MNPRRVFLTIGMLFISALSAFGQAGTITPNNAMSQGNESDVTSAPHAIQELRSLKKRGAALRFYLTSVDPLLADYRVTVQSLNEIQSRIEDIEALLSRVHVRHMFESQSRIEDLEGHTVDADAVETAAPSGRTTAASPGPAARYGVRFAPAFFPARQRARRSAPLGRVMALSNASVEPFWQHAEPLSRSSWRTPRLTQDDPDYTKPTEEVEEDDSPVGDFTISYGFDFTDRPRNNPDGARDMAGPFSFGLTLHPRLSVEVGFDTFLSTKEPGTPRVTGAGDVSLSAEFLALEEVGNGPSVSFVYTTTLPTASVERGLGTGRVDHLLLVALSNKLGERGRRGTIGASLGPSFAGRQGESGFITTGRLNLSYRYRFDNGLGYAARIASRTRGGGRASRASTSHSLSYAFNDRYGVEGGVLAGLTSNAPRLGFFTSFSVSGNLFR